MLSFPRAFLFLLWLKKRDGARRWLQGYQTFFKGLQDLLVGEYKGLQLTWDSGKYRTRVAGLPLELGECAAHNNPMDPAISFHTLEDFKMLCYNIRLIIQGFVQEGFHCVSLGIKPTCMSPTFSVIPVNVCIPEVREAFALFLSVLFNQISLCCKNTCDNWREELLRFVV